MFLAVQEDLVASHRSPLGQSPLNVMQKDLGNGYREARWRRIVRYFQRVVESINVVGQTGTFDVVLEQIVFIGRQKTNDMCSHGKLRFSQFCDLHGLAIWNQIPRARMVRRSKQKTLRRFDPRRADILTRPVSLPKWPHPLSGSTLPGRQVGEGVSPYS